MKLRSIIRTALLASAAAGALSAAPAGSQESVPASLDLQSALRFALQNNFAIREARERIKQQEGVEIEVRAQEIPQVAATGSYNGNRKEISQYFPARSQSWAIALQARENLYAGGGVSASIRSNRYLREAAVLDLQSVINQQLLQVRTDFYSVLLNRQRIIVQEENVKLLEEQLKTAQSRFQAGAASNFEVLQAQVALANGRPPLIQARNDYRISIEVLRQDLGLVTDRGTDMNRMPDFVGTLSVGQPVSYDLSDALNAARSKRPEVLRIEKLVASGQQNVKVARSGYLPRLDAVAGYDWSMGNPTASWNDRSQGWTIGVQGQWNIFDGRATAGRVAQARSVLNQTRLSLDQTTLAVEVDVRRSYSSLQEAWELVESTGKVVQQAEEALRLANVRYSAGSATQLDVLTSQVALTQARLNQLSAYYGYNVALATLRTAMGEADTYAGGN
ncbi:outer membrane efflux protein BepC precursor [mine drainage metagenome]|uniref:Outer membrane efflux protein BepC n=1 Tax=mine drainage metagenome TaxID=410659 RepID=A0A1J5SHX3_9ZZZZ